jgi:predicted nucleic acid-binding Zn ribbon protein
MAKYNYKCNAEHITEHDFSLEEDKPKQVVCPVCGKPAKRTWFSISVHYHGTGFYSTAISRKSGLEDVNI